MSTYLTPLRRYPAEDKRRILDCYRRSCQRSEERKTPLMSLNYCYGSFLRPMSNRLTEKAPVLPAPSQRGSNRVLSFAYNQHGHNPGGRVDKVSKKLPMMTSKESHAINATKQKPSHRRSLLRFPQTLENHRQTSLPRYGSTINPDLSFRQKLDLNSARFIE